MNDNRVSKITIQLHVHVPLFSAYGNEGPEKELKKPETTIFFTLPLMPSHGK